MTKFNIFIPIEKIENLNLIAKEIISFMQNFNKDYKIILCTNKKVENFENVNSNLFINTCENKNIDQVLIEACKEYESDYSIILTLNKNWKKKLSKIISTIDENESIDILRISKFHTPITLLDKIRNFFIKLYYVLINIITVKCIESTIMPSEKYCIAFSKKALNIIKTLPDKFTNFLCCDSLILLNQKNLILKDTKDKENKIVHFEKSKMSKEFKIIFTILAIFIILLFVFILVLQPIYLRQNAMFKYTLLMFILISSTILSTLYVLRQYFYKKFK